MSQLRAVADLTAQPGRAAPPEKALNADRARPVAERGAPQLEVMLSQPRAYAVVLDLLELALVDRSNVDAVVGASMRSRQATRQIAPTSTLLDPDWSPTGPTSFDNATACGDSIDGTTRLLLKLAVEELGA